MIGNFYDWVNNNTEIVYKKALIETSKGTEEIMQKLRLEHEEVSSENPYYFSETTSDRKYYD